ncbi:hypothetical protein CH267_00185 [Rhodococcus sp. 06-621-2]|nr:transposase [Rhodococcus sp. 06-621-2]OZC62812.1 hypothetical protein CH267_00185 [Rhodococcus sp. 06-621-2]
MIAARKYKTLTAELRAAAVETVADVSTKVSSRWRAIELVAETLDVHPNTLRNWVVAAAKESAPISAEEAHRRAREHKIQLDAATDLIAALSTGLHSSGVNSRQGGRA